jgi:hypothetical protein
MNEVYALFFQLPGASNQHATARIDDIFLSL